MSWRAPLLTLLFLAMHMFPASVPDEGGLDSNPGPPGARSPAPKRVDGPVPPNRDSIIRLHLEELPAGEETLYIHAWGRCEPNSSSPGFRKACGIRGD